MFGVFERFDVDEVVDVSKVFEIADNLKFSQKECDRLEMEYFVNKS